MTGSVCPIDVLATGLNSFYQRLHPMILSVLLHIDSGKLSQCSRGVCDSGTLWWSVNLSHIWALNVWTVSSIYKNSQLLIFSSIAIFIVCTGQDVYCDWLRHSQPPIHQVKQPIRDIWHLLILSYGSFRKPEYVSQSKFVGIQHANHAQLLENSLSMERKIQANNNTKCIECESCFTSLNWECTSLWGIGLEDKSTDCKAICLIQRYLWYPLLACVYYVVNYMQESL